MTKETTNIIDFKTKEIEEDTYVLNATFMAEMKHGKKFKGVDDIKRKDANINIVTDKVLDKIDYLNVYLFLFKTIVLLGKDKLNFDYEIIMKSSIDIVNACYEKEETND